MYVSELVLSSVSEMHSVAVPFLILTAKEKGKGNKLSAKPLKLVFDNYCRKRSLIIINTEERRLSIIWFSSNFKISKPENFKKF